MSLEIRFPGSRAGSKAVILCALKPELEALRQVFKPERVESAQNLEESEAYDHFEARGGRVACLRSGMGAARAEAACGLSIRRWKPDFVVDFGIAGALAPGFSVGDLVLADRVLARAAVEWEGPPLHGVPRHPDFTIVRGLRVTAGPVVSLEESVVTAAERADLRSSCGAVAVTWESAAIARACAGEGVEFLCARMISDCDEGDIKALREPAALRRMRWAAQTLAAILRLME